MKFVMIDGDGGSDYDTIGEVEVSMGMVMGARAQMWTGNLAHKGKAGGQIIVRSEAIQASNEAIKFRMSTRQLNNNGGGCMGMCQEPRRYKIGIQKMVPGTNNFATVWTSPQVANNPNGQFGEITLPLSQICNADKNA